MASIANDKNGRRRVIFFQDGKRKTLWLGKVSRRVAEEIKTKVETIVAAASAHISIDGETAAWLGKIGADLHGKLAHVGLATPRVAVDAITKLRLDAFLKSYIAGRTDVKERTIINLEACRSRLVEFFGADKPLEAITAGDAKDWDIWLKARYARATTSRTIKRAKQFFQAAIDREMLARNPFDKIKSLAPANESRQFFITQEAAYKVLAACPDAEWRLLFALSRFGGLRCPSEHLALTWAEVDWERGRFKVNSPKTEHHEGKAFRWVPIFPELRPYLEEAFELAPEGTVHIIRRYRDSNINLRTQLRRIIARAGLDPWPKLFHNLRATRETELAEAHPIHVVCSWIGHAAAIAQKHYLQVTDADFERAANSAPRSKESRKTAQNAAMHRAGTEPAQSDKSLEKLRISAEFPGFCADGEYPRQDSNLR